MLKQFYKGLLIYSRKPHWCFSQPVCRTCEAPPPHHQQKRRDAVLRWLIWCLHSSCASASCQSQKVLRQEECHGSLLSTKQQCWVVFTSYLSSAFNKMTWLDCVTEFSSKKSSSYKYLNPVYSYPQYLLHSVKEVLNLPSRVFSSSLLIWFDLIAYSSCFWNKLKCLVLNRR